MTPSENRYMEQFGMYSKVQDNLFILGNNVIVKMNLILYSNSEKYGRRYYYKEVQYVSKEAGAQTKKILREYDAYVSMENMKPVDNIKEFIIIRGKDIELMRMFLLPRLEELILKSNEIYQVRGNKLYVSDKFKPIECEVGLSKSLIFVPGIHKSYTEEVSPCLNMYLNGSTNMVSLSFNQVYEFMYFIRTFQIHLYGSSMLSYIGRPIMGTNLYDMTDGQLNNEMQSQSLDTKQQRFIGGKNNKPSSYFNK